MVTTGAAFLAVVALLVLTLDGLRQVTAIVGPVFLAFTLVLTVDPLRRRLVARGVPLWLATVGMLALLFGILLTVLLGVGVALTQLVRVLPSYQDQFLDYYDTGVGWLADVGIEVGTMDDVVGGISPSSVVPFLQGVLAQLGSVGMMILFIALGMLFLTMDLGDGRRRLAAVARHRPHLAAALRDFGERIRKYWWVCTLFGFAESVLNYILLIVLDVPLAFVWFMLAFVAGYIPNVGFIIGLVPAAALALLEHGPGTMLAVIVGYMLINFVVKTLIMPKFAGDVVGLSVSVTFLSLVFWTIFVGPLGALLAIPLTLFAKAVLIDSHPKAQWLGTFLVSSDRIDDPSGQGPASVTVSATSTGT